MNNAIVKIADKHNNGFPAGISFFINAFALALSNANSTPAGTNNKLNWENIPKGFSFWSVELNDNSLWLKNLIRVFFMQTAKIPQIPLATIMTAAPKIFPIISKPQSDL